MSHVTLSVDQVRDLAARCLAGNGCDDANAAAVADTITRAEADGCASHGLFRLPGYVASLRSGKVNGAARPRVEAIAPAVLRVDGDGGYAPLAHERSREPIAAMARESGVAAVALVNTHHFAALWAEVEPLAEMGLVAMAMTAYKPAMAPFGAREPLFGTNPMAFGFPRGGGAPPMVFDQASAAMARGEVMIAARDGHDLPPGVGLDRDGKPSTDPNAVLEGVMLPFGGYKGSAIAMMVELLCAGLIGERFSFEAAQADNNDGGPPRGGEFILAMDPDRFGDASWHDHAETFFARYAALDGARLPGARRHAKRAKLARSGVRVPADLHDRIQALCAGPA
ncbi:MAG: Ldh family oxidoreductase [Hyphomicrobiales bacterium]|nr:Ldh family oxidoreductase [Hyphomicrobiales bacterium]MCP5370706.1 Ldh family oxidoreductase [Hyphomicrobiales bacterium]